MTNKIGATVCSVCGGSTLRNINGVPHYRSVQGMCLKCSEKMYLSIRRIRNKVIHNNVNGEAGSTIRNSNTKRGRNWTIRLKTEMIVAYGGKCVCCGESNPVFLTVDHTNGDGAVERRDRGGTFGGARLYKDLRDRGWPKNRYRLLCYNCNIAIGFWGKCPHERD